MKTRRPDPAATEQPAADEITPVADWLQGLNQRLSGEAAHSAEQAFSRGCSTSLIPAGLVIGLAFLLGARHWVSLLLAVLVAGFLALAWAAFAASQAQRRTVELAFLASIWPEIEQQLPLRSLTLDQVRLAARPELPESAPLRTCLDKLASKIQ